MIKVSIVIPTRNASSTLSRLLISIQKQEYDEIETIIVDNSSTDTTPEMAKEFNLQLLRGGPERSSQRNIGALKSVGDVLLFLDADMELTRSVVSRCVDEIDNGVDAVCILEQSVGKGYWSDARALERSGYFRSEIFEAARCFRRKVFLEMGGYDSSLTGVEDFDIQARLVASGYHVGWVDEPILHHEEAIGPLDYIKKRGYYARTDRIYAIRHPERWRRQRSVRERWSYVQPKIRSFSELQLLPGLAILRGLEWLIRK
jgi:glycosyltransferase involved in cell wall biosynthesis